MWEIIKLKKLVSWLDLNCKAELRADVIKSFKIVIDASYFPAKLFEDFIMFLNANHFKFDIERENDKVCVVIQSEWKMNEKKVKGVILVHESGMGLGLAFDIFVKKEYYQEFEKYKNCLYDVECSYVKKFLEKHKD